jgi:Mn2+/Fe2+ NRAMP family transporter
VPLSTAYSVAEAAGREGRLDDGWRDARLFYVTYVAVVAVAAAIVLIPGAPLVRILYLTQALNAVLLLRVLWAIRRIAADPERLGRHALSRTGAAVTGIAFAGIAASVIALGWLSL